MKLKTGKRLNVLSMILLSFVLMSPLQAKGVNFAVFQKSNPDMQYEDTVGGKDHINFVAYMYKKGADISALTNNPYVEEGDVVTLQTSALYDNNGALGDFGYDCSLVYNKVQAKRYMSGICTINRIGRGQNLKKKIIIKKVNLADSTQWVKLAEDKETGVAFYATFK